MGFNSGFKGSIHLSELWDGYFRLVVREHCLQSPLHGIQYVCPHKKKESGLK